MFPQLFHDELDEGFKEMIERSELGGAPSWRKWKWKIALLTKLIRQLPCAVLILFLPKGQLWAVVAMLATKTVDKKDTVTFSELPYVQALQFSISSFKSAFNLQCKFESRSQVESIL